MTNVTIYEQECFGQTHYRAVRDDGLLLFGRHQTDFPSKDEAVSAVLAEFRRKRLGAVRVSFVPLPLCQCEQCRLAKAATEAVKGGGE